jgi:hypothetical protein
MIEQVGNSLKFLAFFTGTKVGVAGLTVTVDVYDPSNTLIVNGSAATEIGGGYYRYTLASGSVTSEGEYLAIFKTASDSVDQKHMPALWVVGRAGVENLDAAVSSRNATAPPSAATVATAVRTELATELGRVDVAVSTRNATAPPTAAAVASQVRTELTTELGRLDAAVTSRAAPGDAMTLTAGQRVKLDASQPDYAPAKAGDAMVLTDAARLALAAAIEAELMDEGTGGAFMAAIAEKLAEEFDIEELSIAAIANATGTYMLNAVLAGNFDIAGSVGKKLQALPDSGTVNTVAPDNDTIAAIHAKTTNLPPSPAATGDIPSAAAVASATRTELATELGRVDVAVSTRNATEPPSTAQIAAAVWANGVRSLTTFGSLVADIWANATRTLTAFGFSVEANAPSAAAIADAVLDEALADHNGAGSVGAALAAAGSAGDPWSATPGGYAEGTMGALFSKLDVGDPDDPVTVTPEPPADQSLCRVFAYLEKPGNEAAAGIEVTFELVATTPIKSERAISGRKVSAKSDADGLLQIDLQRNDLMSPAGSHYLVNSPALKLVNREVTLTTETFNLLSLF